MEQHPVPQQISSYQFRLVGDMTLKQFFQLAGGALVALLFYSSSLPGFLKWPFVAFFALSGAALAFLPLEDRPLEVWVIAFFRSIYSPTLFFWNKPATPRKYFADEALAAQAPLAQNVPATNSGVRNPVLTRLEEQEKNFMSKLTGLFTGAAFTPQPPPGVEVIPPAPPAPVVEQKPAEIAVPQTKPMAIEPTKPEPTPLSPPNTIFQTSSPKQVLAPQPASQAQAAQFSADAAPPTPPTQANIIVGQVMDREGKIVEGAILEVKDSQGRPARALKTNRAGHFLIVTPLANGTYELVTEKGELEFEPVTFEAKGEIIPPIAIHAK